MTAPVMSAAAAAWIRAHVWTASMRRDHNGRDTCACQYGPTGHCAAGHCGKCPRGVPLPSWATVLCARDGVSPIAFSQPYRHKTGTSATGPRFESLAMVWLADRVCEWICPCTCHTAPAPKAKPKPKPESVTVQDSLFEVPAC